jgi:hypothetical protein
MDEAWADEIMRSQDARGIRALQKAMQCAQNAHRAWVDAGSQRGGLLDMMRWGAADFYNAVADPSWADETHGDATFGGFAPKGLCVRSTQTCAAAEEVKQKKTVWLCGGSRKASGISTLTRGKVLESVRCCADCTQQPCCDRCAEQLMGITNPVPIQIGGIQSELVLLPNGGTCRAESSERGGVVDPNN